ncbi:MAG TPA: peroxiredoxin [Nitrosomonas nitrosa]|mgnify:CR=1 FL=1|jgi:peroxiredoxin Q/BCP|uniref:thioredoxin-dependent peroxiredoxin n=1 Tax=Nitrosomonas nitrosa TaxID=52442 RepID=A0A1I4M5S5_9PROT|nr:peroxiredoxin [Nitrosomonas nitrosa]MCO6433511.1 peroxiredoxin [Nitrosomonas nitrosa]PTQ92294.1 peroxiredoxin Q/BCP [Nitrosomonas nitrosa]SFL98574.1 peroxiredoxin Q/BCP [Nitrosomonas nitrosa]HBZ29728.1 peroxiredoxin [Nitrosomonas nitrosa]HNP50761.1 peroxiredoxin [Nitrosomonas nitrosa]
MLNAAPDFELESTGNKKFRLATLGKNLVIYFYPKDDTPGCTDESLQFRDLYAEFSKIGCEIIGISRDSIKSHEKFKEKLSLPFDLLSDSEETVCELYNVIKMKNMYGKQVRGIERSTFVVDKEGNLRKEWRGVKVPNHAAEVLSFVKEL